jgi:uncharacterized protein YbjT (DUF2867 family)
VKNVLVTGGTGVLGVHLVRELRRRGHEVRVLSRSENPSVPSGARASQGDVRTGAGLANAMAGVNCVVHAATSPFRRVRQTEVNVIAEAAAAQVEHLVYVSIVGVDSIWVPYYRAKWAAEQVVERAPIPWTIQRFTQFHELIDRMLGLPVGIRTRNLAFQSIAAQDAAVRLADLVDQGPLGRVVDIGGPEVLPIRAMRAQRRRRGHRNGALLVPVPRVGALRDLDAGVLMTRAASPYGVTTWRTWLEDRTSR